jgi:hypothetical protein
MSSRCYLGIAVVAYVLCAGVRAQDEQWLQYRCTQDARSTMSGLGMRGVELAKARPQDLKTPQFKDAQPFFGKWTTPMAKAGFLWFALDRSTAKGPYDRLCIDSNGNGQLDDEGIIKAYQSGSDQTLFGLVKVVLQGEDGPVSFHLDLQVYNSGGSPYCYISPAGWYEGDISVDGVKTHCVLLDYTTDGTFNDTSLDPGRADRIIVGDADAGVQPCCVGRLVEFKGTLY